MLSMSHSALRNAAKVLRNTVVWLGVRRILESSAAWPFLYSDVVREGAV